MAGNRCPCRLSVIEIDFTQCHAFIVNFKRETLALSKFAKNTIHTVQSLQNINDKSNQPKNDF